MLWEGRSIFPPDEGIDDLIAFILVIGVFVVEGAVHAVDYVGFLAERTVADHLQ